MKAAASMLLLSSYMSVPEGYKIPEVEYANASAPNGIAKPIVSIGKRIGRNAPCPCGSGIKFKKCCQGAAK